MKKNIESYLDRISNYLTITSPEVGFDNKRVIRTRTRNTDMAESMQMKTYDPLWMLSRQWQMGEFKGNNAGTALSVRCTVDQYDYNNGCGKEPVEYYVERVARDMTPYERLTAAMHYTAICRTAMGDEWRAHLDRLMARQEMLVDDDYVKCGVDDATVKDAARSANTKMKALMAAMGGKALDGLKLYRAIVANDKKAAHEAEYVEWFEQRFMPAPAQAGVKSQWDSRQMAYDATVDNDISLKPKRYAGGRLSWYSFDAANATGTSRRDNVKTTTVVSLPTLATYAAAPTKRLWQFEDHKVYLGNSSTGVQYQGNVILMQHASMYSNDMMLVPLATEIGNYIEVKDITVWDTFGDCFHSTARKNDGWGMFDITVENSRDKLRGLLMPPCFVDTLESKPMEEVRFMRDEMANMIWGVETLVPDGAGGTLDSEQHARKVGAFIADVNERKYKQLLGEYAVGQLKLVGKEKVDAQTASVTPDVEENKHSDFRYLVQTSVPLNWIPFLPQQLWEEHGGTMVRSRDTILRRGKMPCFLYDDRLKDEGYLLPVRPVTSLIATEMERKADGSVGEVPLYVNEEEVLQTGITVTKNFQRGRWLNGKTYHWYGVQKQLRGMDANSGLTFDKLATVGGE